MSQNPWLRPESPDATPQEKKPPQATAFFSGDDLKSVTEVAETLAAHGGGALSGELALDLVLHNMVEQARQASGATGAAIALLRNGEMVCRATTGDNAPDLGVRVETGSSLASACLETGQVQQCRDTETDSRVNPEACRRLGVRSMLLVPLVDASRVFGILQVFSAWPNAFGEKEINSLKVLAERIAENKRAAQASAVAAPVPQPAAVSASSDASKPGGEQNLGEQNSNQILESPEWPGPSPELPELLMDEPRRSTGSEIWSSALVAMVIAIAVLLGVVIGWRGAAKVGTGGSPRPPVAAAPAESQTGAASSLPDTAPPDPGPVAAPSEPPAPVSGVSAGPANSAPPSGSLVVTENGKVIYRMPGAVPPRSSATRLIHRVEPQYPPEARAQNLQGAVVLDLQINGDGTVGAIDVASGDPALANAAVLAVKQWRYQPYFVNGRAVESQARITVRFKLPPG